MMTAREVDELADLILTHAIYGGREGFTVTAEDRDAHDYGDCQKAAQAILALGYVRPDIEEEPDTERSLWDFEEMAAGTVLWVLTGDYDEMILRKRADAVWCTQSTASGPVYFSDEELDQVTVAYKLLFAAEQGS